MRDYSEYHVYIINEDEGDDKDNDNGGRYRRAKGGGNYS